jgi:hypothetical protein
MEVVKTARCFGALVLAGGGAPGPSHAAICGFPFFACSQTS